MKIDQTSKIGRVILAALGGFALFAGTVHSAPFLYGSGDLLLAFRQTGSSSDLVVNIGKATNYNNLPAGTTIPIANLSVGQLNAAFPSLNSLKWSAAAANRAPFNTNYAEQTLWVVAPRSDVNTKSVPWKRKSSSLQSTSGAVIEQIGYNAAASSSSQASNANNTVTGVVIPVSTDYRLSTVFGTSGDYDSTFQGSVENPTPEDFDSDPQNITRSDLYELLPGTVGGGTFNTDGRYLGYFELKGDGSLTFNTITPTPSAPTITNIQRSGNVSTVYFTTVNGANYTLRSTDSSGLVTPISTWSVGDSINGTGSVLSLTDTNSGDARFYSVEVQ